jgi:MATE family multidrug resistance protein
MDLEEEKPSIDLPLISPGTAIKSRHGFSKVEIVEEVKKQLVLAGPLVTVNFFIFLLQVISVMFVGHLGELALSGASMATSFASVTGLSLLVRGVSPIMVVCNL